MERIFITGEDGQLARLLRSELEARGHVVVNGDVRAERTWRTEYNRERELDFTLDRVLNAVAVTEPTIVVHAGAICGTDKCEKDPITATRVNVLGTAQVARWFPRAHFVYLSTTAIYDKDAPRPLNEESHVAPYTVYGQTKWAGELVARAIVAPERLTVLRPCFVYGGGRDTSSVLAELVRRGLRRYDDRTLLVMLDPNRLKDFLYAGDFARMAAAIVSDKQHGTFNVVRGRPRPYSVVMALLRQHGLEPFVKFSPADDYLGDHVVSTLHRRHHGDLLDLEQGIPLVIEEIERS